MLTPLAPDSPSLVEEGRDLLSAWREGLVDAAQVVAWADSIIQESVPAAIPEWILDLSMFGPARCMSRPSSDFIAVPVSPFRRAFALRVSVLPVQDDDQVRMFVRWCARASMGQDLDDPVVQFGYHLEHLWCDCDRMAEAVAVVRAELPGLASALPQISERVRRAMARFSNEAG
jgi:hypothetical protein